MPVVVTGASGFIGRSVVAAFARTSPEVRAYVRRRDRVEELRALGAKVAVGGLADLDTLATVMADAHTLCHLVGGANAPSEGAYHELNAGSVEAALRAAGEASVHRVLFLSYPGASPEAANAYLRAKGAAEEAVRATGIDHVIVRCTHVYGPRGPWLEAMVALGRRRPAVVLGTGRQVVAPVFVEDVAAVLAAADDRNRGGSGTWGLEGPDRVKADALAGLLGARVPRLHLGPGGAARLPALARRRTGRTALEILAADSLADGPDAAAEFGVPRTPLREGLRRSLAP